MQIKSIFSNNILAGTEVFAFWWQQTCHWQLCALPVSPLTFPNKVKSTDKCRCFLLGWDGGIRTPECLDQNQVPYHLATSHQM